MPDIESPPRYKGMSLSGWGRFGHFDCRVIRCEKISEFEQSLDECAPKSMIARGSGRSYGDAALNASGFTILTEQLDRLLEFDESSGLLKAESGISLEALLKIFVPRGWMIPVVPGTKFISLGGAVAADIHGKNHHKDGSFSKHLKSFELIDGNGSIRQCSRQENADVFWATVGGMGLTGLITNVQLQLQKIPSAHIRMKAIPARNFSELVKSYADYEEKHHFSVAWLDCLAKGESRGRGVLLLGDFEEGHDHKWHPKTPISIPMEAPNFLLNELSMSAFNELYYRLPRPETQLIDADKYFFPLDRISNWNRLYGTRGFIQYQCLLRGDGASEGLERILKLCQEEGIPSYFAVLKRFAKAEKHEHATLSFPDEGYTLAMDFPGSARLSNLCQKLDQIVIEYGGRIYLAKDSMLDAATFSQMYPQATRWQEVCHRLNAEQAFSSNLAIRLGLRP